MTEISDKGKGLTPLGETAQIAKGLKEVNDAVKAGLPKDVIIQGRNLMLFRQGTGGYVPLGAATSHTLNITAENADISNKDTAQFHAVLPGGNINWTVSASCMASWLDLQGGSGGTKGLVDDLVAGAVYKVAFGMIVNPSPDGVKPADGWKVDTSAAYVGDAFISSIAVSAPYDSQVTYDVEFQGSGPLLPYGTAVALKKIPDFNKNSAE
ncbi:putative secreted protein [Bacteroidales bacterium Barb7]|nr:putative secreted protein [Bacteroidales bacterium Barb7]